MAFHYKYTRCSAVCQTALGILCMIFGIIDRVHIFRRRYHTAFQTEGVIAIWIGAWFLVTGFLGLLASRRSPNTERPRMALIGTYMAFSIVATVFAGVMIICYAIGIAIIQGGKPCSDNVKINYKSHYEWPTGPYRYYTERISYVKQCRTSVALGAMIIIFAIVEFGVGIWASVCCCTAYNGGCCDASTPQSPQMQGQVVYLQTQGATGPVATYVMTQGPNGMPVSVPAMATAGVYPVANQAGGQVYMQNYPRGATAVVPTQQVQSVSNPVSRQPEVTTQRVTPASYDPPPDYRA